MDVMVRLERGIPDVPWARHQLIAAMQEEQLTADPDHVGLVATELLTNALLHGREPVRLRAAVVDDHLRIEVHDASEATPLQREATAADTTGRGLMLVAGLVERWGVDRSGDGKCVWAEFPAGSDSVTTVSNHGGQDREVRLPDRPVRAASAGNGSPAEASGGQTSSTAQGVGSSPFVSSSPAAQFATRSQ